jgi:hypothetical protein
MPRDRLIGRGPVAVAAAEHGVAHLGERILRQVAAEPFDELRGVVGRRAIVGGAEDQHAALLRQLADVIVERRQFGGKAVDLGEIGDAGGEFLGGAEVGAVEHQQRRVVPRRVRARGAGASMPPPPRRGAAGVAPRSLSVRGRTLILKPSGLIVSVSFSTSGSDGRRSA